MTEKRKVLLLDGHSLAFRAYFALPTSLATSAGQVTNAVYGFTSMLIKLIGDERPHGVAVCFDRAAPTFRLEAYPEYKAGRSQAPDDFREQLPLIREVLSVLRIPILELDGFEADDLLATLARRLEAKDDETVVVTGDRDCLQLVRPGVTVMMTRRGISDIARYDGPAVVERYGIPPDQWTDFAALKGETSDNLPGVPGVGDKTAAQLVQKYGSVEGVIEHADELRPKIRDALVACADQVRLNKELGRLRDDVDLDADPDEIVLEPWDDEEVRKLFTALEFRVLYERLKELRLVAAAAAPALELESFRELGEDEAIPEGAPAALALEGDWLAVSTGGGEALVVPAEAAPGRLAAWLAAPGVPKVAHDAKPLVRLVLESGGEMSGLECDTQIAAYLLEPGMTGGYPLPDVVRRYLGVAIDEPPGAMGGGASERPASTSATAPSSGTSANEREPPMVKAPAKAKQAALDLEPDRGERAARAAVAVHALAPVLTEHLRNRGMVELAQSLEFPLIRVLARMERAGIAIDLPYLEELGEDLGDRTVMLEKRIHGLAGEPFNVNSNPQLQKVLFEQLGLPKTKRIKTGWSTDAAELAKLAGTHPIVDALLEYREVAKLKSGFTDSLIPLVNPKTGRIHTTYLQIGAATGRLASTNPNVQNIPIRGELGRQVRRAFIAPPGRLLLSADYSQIELRVLAHLTGDEGLLDAFASGHDFHAAIGAKVYAVDVADATPQMRSYAKQFSYGIAYGMSAYGVSQRLGVNMDEAREFIDAYYAQFPKVKAFLEAQVAKAAADGFTTTMFGRRRYLPELQSPNPRIRALGERMALNAPIQGSAADIIKRAMIDVDRALEERPEVATMLLSVHDELVFEVPEDRRQEAEQLVREHMEAAADLLCGLRVEAHFGRNWSEAHA